MAASPSDLTLYFLLLFSTLLLLTSGQNLFFNGFKSSANKLTLSGEAIIDQYGILQLTNTTPRLLGHAFYTSPIRFKTSSSTPALSFSAVFAISIVPQFENLGGHGMAFAIASDKQLKGASSNQYLGLLNGPVNENITHNLVAIEFDTITNVEFKDIDNNHVGIDINSMRSNASATAGYYVDGNSTKQVLNLTSGQTILAWVDYDSATTTIDVRLSLTSQKPKKGILSYKFDLTPYLDEYMYVGFSASTGLLASSHYVMGWSFNVSGEAAALDLSELPSLPKPKGSKLGLILGSSLGSVLLVIISGLVVCIVVWWYRNREVIEPWELEIGPHRFPYGVLREATRGFSHKELIGFGGFGKVYKGTLPATKQEVAVKRVAPESKQGLQEFVAEIASVGQLRHRNLVQLLGWCRRRGDLLLVYDYMPNGSLDKYLFNGAKRVLSWKQRFSIVKGVASGLFYLHEGWDQTVIHRDVKAGNVLLDGEMNGKLGDFGLAKLYEHGSYPTTTRVVGTMGYLAPELTKTGKPTTSSDVFAFGAFLLEVACGRRPVEPKALPEELILVDYVWDRWKGGGVLDVVDRKLKGEFDEAEAMAVLKLGLMCSTDNPANRPSMRQVVRYLEGEVPLPEVIQDPGGFNGNVGRGGSGGFEDYVNSTSSSSWYGNVIGSRKEGDAGTAGGSEDIELCSTTFSVSSAGYGGR